MVSYASRQEGQTVTLNLGYPQGLQGGYAPVQGQVMQPGALVEVQAAARLEIHTSCLKCLFDAYFGQFDLEQCKGQIPSHIANTGNNGLAEFEQLMIDLNAALRYQSWLQWLRKGTNGN